MDYIDFIPCYLPDDECWEYQGTRTSDGYGTFGRSPKTMAHRTMYQEYYGDTLIGNDIVRHTCDNPACCNPHHLLKGTHSDNVNDCIARNRRASRAGENNGRARLNRQTVDDIRKINSSGMWSNALLCQLFELPRTTVFNIVNNITWL